jgi:type IV fimbrial biogenesis protein FimT
MEEYLHEPWSSNSAISISFRNCLFRQHGLTLVELMITVAIAAILVTVGLPSFSTSIKNNRLTTEVNRFVAQIQLARSEAIKRNQVVSLCRSSNASTCGGAGSGIYEQGWLLYADASGQSKDDYEPDEGDELIQVGDAAAASLSIRANTSAASWLSFSTTGMLKGSSSAQYLFCDKDGSTATVPGRRLVIDLSGQPKLDKLAAGADCGS